MNKKFKIICSSVAIILVITLIGTGIYLNNHYHANESAISVINNTNNVNVS